MSLPRTPTEDAIDALESCEKFVRNVLRASALDFRPERQELLDRLGLDDLARKCRDARARLRDEVQRGDG